MRGPSPSLAWAWVKWSKRSRGASRTASERTGARLVRKGIASRASQSCILPGRWGGERSCRRGAEAPLGTGHDPESRAGVEGTRPPLRPPPPPNSCLLGSAPTTRLLLMEGWNLSCFPPGLPAHWALLCCFLPQPHPPGAAVTTSLPDPQQWKILGSKLDPHNTKRLERGLMIRAANTL